MPRYNPYLINCGGLYERVMAYAIGNHNLNYKLLNDIKHDHDLKSKSY